jgi:hypothetical protein
VIDRWSEIVKRGKPYLPKIALAFLILGVIGAGFSLYAAWCIKSHIPAIPIAEHQQANIIHDNYLVSKDGDLLKIDGINKYDLHTKKDNLLIMKGKSGEKVPTYILLFTKAPAHVEVTNQEGATTNLKEITPYEYNVQFYSTGWGSPAVECYFRIEVY